MRANNNYKINKVIIYPNPSNEIIEVKNLDSYETIYIFNMNGTRIKTFKKNQIININQFTKGMYILKTDTGYVGKFKKK